MAKKHPWYKRKGYLHFDKSLSRADAERYVSNEDNIKRHRFSPLIHYGKISKKVSRDKAAERAYKALGSAGTKPKLIIKEKKRNIFYTAHVDGYIYSYYAHKLGIAYDDFLKKHDLSENIIAYRPIQKNGKKYFNADFAHEAFEFVRNSENCIVMCFDISKFFDKLSTKVLKENWEKVLNKKLLDEDHYKVFKSLENFRYVEEGQLIENFKDRFKKNPRQHGLEKDSGGSTKNRICDYPELRALDLKQQDQGKRLLKKKTDAQITGIPQGTSISGLLSNIFMINFDLAIKKEIESKGGFYRRYSDDIFIAVPSPAKYEDVSNIVSDNLILHCGDSIKLNKNKTEAREYKKIDGTHQIVTPDGKQARVQYLGFHFDGQNVYIRNSSVSKDRGKTVQSLRRHKKKSGNIDTNAVYKERSPRKITKYDNLKKKGFAYYAERSSEAHGNTSTISKQIKKNDRFIKRALHREKSDN